MAKRFDFKIQGQTSANAAIATKAVEFHDDGSLRFTSAAGVKVLIQPSADLNALLQQIFTGTGGFAAGTKLHGNA
jgi:hypothetical protein